MKRTFFYSKIQPDAQHLKFILFWNNTLRVRTVFLSIRSLRLYIHHQVYVIQNLYDMYLML